jgi:DNA-binding NtrC family response regulator
MAPRLTIRSSEGVHAEAIDLAEGAAVLVGRSPSLESLGTIATDHGLGTPTLVKVHSPSVSGNHLLAWSRSNAVYVEDLSRNGTWLQLTRGRPICAGEGEAVVHLVRPTRHSQISDDPVAPFWSARADFASALAAAVRGWAPLKNLDVEVRVIRRAEEPAKTAIPLATGESMIFLPRATTDANWSGLVERLWRWVAEQNAIFDTEEQARAEGMILASRSIRSAHREVVDAARSGARSLLLTGPSGAGKECLAEVFHRQSGRDGPLVSVNCSMFSKEFLRAELFGAESGSFTGASKRIVGAVERAQNGTLFLDEIGDMQLDLQPMLLRFLDRREFDTLGKYGKPQKADVRVVAATNRDLRAGARSGTFRPDLWYRLSVHVVDVPPLRTRPEDIDAYLDGSPRKAGELSILRSLSPAALDIVRGHAWDGNFRELTNFRERLLRATTAGTIDADTCRRALERGSLHPVAATSDPPARSDTAVDWGELAGRAIAAFVEDRGREPKTWDDQKEWNEKYLKPLVFYHLSAAGDHPSPHDDDGIAALAGRSATRLSADRGTSIKQLTRYFQRFFR